MATGAIKGAEVCFSNFARQLGVSLARGSEREEESTNSKMCTRPGLLPPSLTRSSVVPSPLPCPSHPCACGLSPLSPPWHPSAFLSVFPVLEVRACAAPPMSTAGSGVRS